MGMSKHTRSRRSSDMSQKSGKRHKKKTENESELTMEQTEENNTTNGSEGASSNGKGDDMELKGFTIEEVESNKSTNEQSQEKMEEETVKTENNGETVEQAESTTKAEEKSDSANLESDIATMDTEEVELQFDEDSDKDSNKESPNRCMTRRSQFRNIPTPKTPKSVCDQNGDDKELDKEDIPVSDKVSETNGEETLVSPNVETESKLETDSMANLSTCAIAGDDVSAKDLDLTINDVPLRANQSDPLINPYKEKSLGDTLRGLSSRRTIRPGGHDYRKYAIKSNMEKANLNMEKPILAARSSIERLSGMKRKNESESPERTKKAKPNSPGGGIMSYITSPIGQIKTRFCRSELPSSTPKLTSYKQQADIFDKMDVSKIEGEESSNKKEAESGKWCSIM